MKKILSNFNQSSPAEITQTNKKSSKSKNILDFIPEDSSENPITKDKELIQPKTETTSQGPFIIVDSRETQSAVARELALKGINVVLKQLPVADYVISNKVGIERKTDSDFVDSLKDGRLFDELYNLSQNFIIPILIIEGDPKTHRVYSKSAILGALSSIIVNMRISVLYTDSATETAELLEALINKVFQDKKTNGKVYTKKTSTEAEAQEQIISGIPGINLYRAQELLTAFSNVENIFNAAEEDLEKVSGIGKKTAKKIREIAEFDYNKEKK